MLKRLLPLFLCLSMFYASGICAAVSANDSITVKVGIYENQPKIFTDDKGNPSGFWPDIIEYIALKEGWKIEYIHGSWTECLEKLEKNEIDIMPDVAYSEEREKIYDFSKESVYVSWSRVYTEEGSDIQSIPDLEGKTIAVLKGSINVEGPDGIKKLVKAFNISCAFIEVDSYLKVFELVENKEADAGVVSKDFAYNHEDEFNVAGTAIVFQPVHLYFAFPQESSLKPYLIEKIDYHVQILKGDGDSKYYQSLEKWFGAKAIEKPVIPAWVKWLLISVGGLVFVLATGFFTLRFEVKRKTKELAEDIAKRKQAEEALQESLQFNSSVLENSPHPILVRKPDTSIIYVNPALEKLTGFASSELIGEKKVFPFWTEEQLKEHSGNLEKAISMGIYKHERQFLKKNKEPFWVEVAAISIKSKGQIKYFLSNWTDIAERKRAEEALTSSEIKYRRLFEAARDGILILNAETGLIIDVNPFLVEMLGFSHSEFLGKKIWELGLLKDIIANKDAFVELQRKGFVRYEGLPLVTNAGLRLEVEFVSNIYEVDHKKVIQCNIRDITERKRAEQARERLSRQLRAKVSELEAFSYGIAHDLKSPMVSIESFSRLLREDIQNQKVEDVQEDIRLLESGVRKMQDFLNRTLAYSRAEHLIKRTKDVSFGKIVNEVIVGFSQQISSIGATVSLADKFPRVYADKIRIAEVLTNLIQNSIKYQDKTVPLKIEIGYRLSEDEAVFFVRDNGLGIDASETEKVFTLFYRGTADGEGSGIGLAIVKKIIEAHGGRIWVQDGQSGKGTTMCFTLPRQNGTDKDNNHEKN